MKKYFPLTFFFFFCTTNLSHQAPTLPKFHLPTTLPIYPPLVCCRGM